MSQNNNHPFDEFYYRAVCKNYPREITLDQMRTICKIAKRTAKYLLDQGIVPCKNTGKKTRQYTILRDDVIAYLETREAWGTENLRIPNPMKQQKNADSFSLHIHSGMEKEIGYYFEKLFKEYPDVLYMTDAIYLTGMSKEALRRRIKANQIEAVYYRKKFLIPKKALFDFVQSPAYLSAFFTSERFHQIIGGFLLRQQDK